MKTIKYLIFSILFVSLFSCNVETEDIVTGDAVEAGVSLEIGPLTTGKALGSPANPIDLPNSSVSFTDVSATIQVIKRWAGENVVKYELYKSVRGGAEVKIKESATLPMSISYTNINEFIAGTQITNSDQLRIGDIFKFRTKVTTSTGESYFIHDGGEGDYSGTYKITVSCASNMAGNYSVVTTNLTSGYVKNHGTEAVVETGVGTYVTKTTGTWGIGTIAPDQGYDFQDICGTLTVPFQHLCQEYYSNEVLQSDAQRALSLYNSTTGDFVVYYTITFSAGPRDYKSVYTKL